MLSIALWMDQKKPKKEEGKKRRKLRMKKEDEGKVRSNGARRMALAGGFSSSLEILRRLGKKESACEPCDPDAKD